MCPTTGGSRAISCKRLQHQWLGLIFLPFLSIGKIRVRRFFVPRVAKQQPGRMGQ